MRSLWGQCQTDGPNNIVLASPALSRSLPFGKVPVSGSRNGVPCQITLQSESGDERENAGGDCGRGADGIDVVMLAMGCG